MSVFSALTDIANAIRAKTGKTNGMTLDQMAGEIEGIQTGGGGGFADGNLVLSEHTVTVEDGNGVTNHANLLNYFYSLTGKIIIAYSLIGIADTYNQPICAGGSCAQDAPSYVNFCYRYRDGYINIPQAFGNGAYDAVLVVGTQYKVYCVERNE